MSQLSVKQQSSSASDLDRGIEAAEIGGHLGDVVPQRRQTRRLDPPLEALMQPVETRHLAGDLPQLHLEAEAGDDVGGWL